MAFFKKIFIFFFCFLALISAAKIDDEPKRAHLNPKEASIKASHILIEHATIHTIDGEIAKRILSNYVDLLDPTKTYFLASDVQPWQSPDEQTTKKVMAAHKTHDFEVFETIYHSFLEAIKRRGAIELELLDTPLLEKTADLKELDWAKNEEELKERLLQIKSIQEKALTKLPKDEQAFLKTKILTGREKREFEFINYKQPDYMLTLFLKAFALALDPHTEYLSPMEIKQLTRSMKSSLMGIGVELRQSPTGGLKITRLLEGPAKASGKIHVDDVIIKVGDVAIFNMDLSEAVELIQGPKGTYVTLTVVKPHGAEVITLKRDKVMLTSERLIQKTQSFADGVIAHIRLTSYYDKTGEDLKAALKELQSKADVKGVILDLRSNGGGLLEQSVEVAGAFIKRGVVVLAKESGRTLSYGNPCDNPIYPGPLPLIVLVNKLSASASEITAKTLQEYGRALVVGETSFGKGSFQQFASNGDYKVTRGCYYTVSGKTPQLQGVVPDIAVPGIYSEMKLGEKLLKYPLEGCAPISPSFGNTGFQISCPPAARCTKTEIQEQLKLPNFVQLLKTNSENRIKENESYQKFILELKKEEPDWDEIEKFGAVDFQLDETFNVMKDWIYLSKIGDKT